MENLKCGLALVTFQGYSRDYLLTTKCSSLDMFGEHLQLSLSPHP